MKARFPSYYFLLFGKLMKCDHPVHHIRNYQVSSFEQSLWVFSIL